MKSAFFNFMFLLGVLILTFFVGMTTPLSTISNNVEPPEKEPRHIYLENKKGQGYTREEMDELYKEIEKFELRWRQKEKLEMVGSKEGLMLVLSRIEFIFILVICIFSIFYKIRTYADLISLTLVMLAVTFIIPILSIGGLSFSLMISLIISTYRLKLKGTLPERSPRIKGDVTL